MVAQQATAAPCVKCGTTGGFSKKGCARPNRARGLCVKCYNALYWRAPGGKAGIDAFLASLEAPTPIRPEVAVEITPVPAPAVERALERRAEYEERCRLAHRAVVPDATITEVDAPTSQDRIDLLVGRLARLEAEADNLALLMDRDRAELAGLRGVRA
jgi:hypothetical protein